VYRNLPLRQQRWLSAHAAYQKAFGDDPTIGTMSVTLLSNCYKNLTRLSQLFAKALSYAGTMAGLAIEQALGATPIGYEYKDDCATHHSPLPQ
jgi:hypothetical protein